MSIKKSRRDFLKTTTAAVVGASLAPVVAKAQVGFIPIAPYFGKLYTRTNVNVNEITHIVDRLKGQLPLLTDVALDSDIWSITGNVLGYGTMGVGCPSDAFSDMALSLGDFCEGNTDNNKCNVHGCRDDQCPNLDCGNNHCNGQTCTDNNGCTNQTDPTNINYLAWNMFRNELISIINVNPAKQFEIKLTYQTQNYVFPI